MSVRKLGKAVLVSYLDDIRYRIEGIGQIFVLSRTLKEELKLPFRSLKAPSYPFLANFSKNKDDIYQKELKEYEASCKEELDAISSLASKVTLSTPVMAWSILKNGNTSKTIYCVYKNNIYKFDRTDYSEEHMLLQINYLEEEEKRKFEYLRNKSSFAHQERGPIPKDVQREVWRRDRGKCVECGSQDRLELDHIIPFSKGGSSTARNIQLLCEKCNRSKHNNI